MPVEKPVKLIIQIPCYNEAATLPATLEALPRHLTTWVLRDPDQAWQIAESELQNGIS